MKRKELPIWLKIETILFLFFSTAILISYFNKIDGSEDSQQLSLNLMILIGGMMSVCVISLVVCCFDKR